MIKSIKKNKWIVLSVFCTIAILFLVFNRARIGLKKDLVAEKSEVFDINTKICQSSIAMLKDFDAKLIRDTKMEYIPKGLSPEVRKI